MTEELLYDKRGDVAWVTFNRPQARNALTFAMYQGLAEICGRIEKTREAKALVITGAGDKAFAAGTDIAQFRDFKAARTASATSARWTACLKHRALHGADHRRDRRFLHRRRYRHRRVCDFGIAAATPSSACLSPGRWAIACRWRTTRGWPLLIGPQRSRR